MRSHVGENPIGVARPHGREPHHALLTHHLGQLCAMCIVGPDDRRIGATMFEEFALGCEVVLKRVVVVEVVLPKVREPDDVEAYALHPVQRERVR